MSDKYNKEEESTIQKIQSKSGCLLFVIGIAMLAFVLTDLLSSGSSIFSSNSNAVGKIGGQDVDYNEYTSLYEKYIFNVQQSNPDFPIDEAMKKQYQDQAWNALIQEKLVEGEYKKLGLGISGEEMKDITFGDNPHPQLQRAFVNPDTKQFDKARLKTYLTEDIEVNPEAKANWLEFEEGLAKDLMSEKYSNLLSSAVYMTELEAAQLNANEQQKRNIQFVGLEYNSISDSLVKVSENDILKYAKARKKKFEMDANRDIEYVVFNVAASSEDSFKTLQYIANNKDEFATTTADSLFVIGRASEVPYSGNFAVRGGFPSVAEDAIFSAAKGTVVGPYVVQGRYSLYKIVDEGTDSLRSVKASHIVTRINGFTKEDTAKAISDASALLAQIKSGAKTFDQVARENNFDGTGLNGGDLGWLREKNSRMPKEFVNKALNTPNGGYFIVSTSNGVHIGKVTSNVSRKTVKVATLQQTVMPSTETDKMIYQIAGEFQSKVSGKGNFEEAAEEMGLTKRIATQINEKTRVIAGLSESNVVARWLFENSTKQGDVSDIIEIDGKYVVAKVSKIRKKGIPDADDLRAEIEPLVINEKKAEILKEKIEAAMEGGKSFEDIAKKLNTTVFDAPFVGLKTGTLPQIGPDEILIGAGSGTPLNKTAGPVIGKTGVYLVKTISLVKYDQPTDLKPIVEQFMMQLSQGFTGKAQNAVIEKGEIKDLRYKFFN